MKISLQRRRDRLSLLMKSPVFFTIINLVLTLATASLAAVSVYYNYFRVSDNLEARMTWTESGPEYKNDSLSIKIAVFNTGNRSAVITRMEIVRLSFTKNSISSKEWAAGQVVRPTLPILIPAGDIQLLQIITPYAPQDWFNHSVECDSAVSPAKGTRCINLGINWGALDSHGKTFRGAAMVAHLYVDQNGAIGGASLGNTIDLFSQTF